MTLDEIRQLPPTLTDAQAAKVLGCSAWTLGQLAREGRAPVKPLDLGRLRRWPTIPILRLVGIDPEGPE